MIKRLFGFGQPKFWVQVVYETSEEVWQPAYGTRKETFDLCAQALIEDREIDFICVLPGHIRKGSCVKTSEIIADFQREYRKDCKPYVARFAK
jgi:hypothetical protein